MNLDIEKLQSSLCTLLCAQIVVRTKNEKLLAIETPFFFPDGDPYQIYLKEMPNGVFRLSDMGHTMLHLSYDNDVSKFREGTRGKLFDQIKAETFLEEEDGEFYIETQIENLGFSLFRLGQALTKISDLTFLNRARAESTFYEDLQEQLMRIVGEENVIKDYHYSEMENSHDYPIDFKINGRHAPPVSIWNSQS